PVVQRPRRLRHMQETMVQVHPGSLLWSAGVLTARIPPWYGGGPGSIPGRTSRQLGCSSNGKTPASQAGNRGSTPRRSTVFCPGGETDIISRFEREVSGSTPDRGTPDLPRATSRESRGNPPPPALAFARAGAVQCPTDARPVEETAWPAPTL